MAMCPYVLTKLVILTDVRSRAYDLGHVRVVTAATMRGIRASRPRGTMHY